LKTFDGFSGWDEIHKRLDLTFIIRFIHDPALDEFSPVIPQLMTNSAWSNKLL
jgi:hypothetical protein